MLDGDLRSLSDWQRRYLPRIHTPLGQQVLDWLIRNRTEPKPFTRLVVATSFSTTSVRHLLNQFIVLGLVEVRKNPVTFRRGEIVAAPKLKERLEEYAQHMKGILSQAGSDGALFEGERPPIGEIVQSAPCITDA